MMVVTPRKFNVNRSARVHNSEFRASPLLLDLHRDCSLQLSTPLPPVLLHTACLNVRHLTIIGLSILRGAS